MPKLRLEPLPRTEQLVAQCRFIEHGKHRMCARMRAELDAATIHGANGFPIQQAAQAQLRRIDVSGEVLAPLADLLQDSGLIELHQRALQDVSAAAARLPVVLSR